MVPPSSVGVDAVLLGHQLVEEQQDGGGGVDGHRRGHLVERQAVQQQAHVGHRVDGHPDLAHLALGPGMVGVVSHLGGQVEGAREPGLAGTQQELEPLIGRLGGAEPGVLAHGPQPAPVHVVPDAPGVGVVPGSAQAFVGVPPLEVVRAVDRADLDARVGEPLAVGLGGRAVRCHGHRLRSPSPVRGRAARTQPAAEASATWGMHRSSYSAMTISPASGPHAGQWGSRCTLKVRKLCSRAS